MVFRTSCFLAINALALGLGSAELANHARPEKSDPNGPWSVPVLMIRYFPLAADRQTIDIRVTSNVGAPLKLIRAKCDRMTREVVKALQEGSRFRAYKNPKAPASLKYTIVKTIDYLEPMPRDSKKKDKADYNAILKRAGIRDYVENEGVKEVWIWGYHSNDLSPWESNMASQHGDISNSDRDGFDLPVLGRTYVVYHYNYQRETTEAVHNHIHQIEAVMRHYGGELWKTWEGEPGRWRCGNCHFPPNGRRDYDWANREYVDSDIEDWQPEGFGTKKRLNCDRWGGDSLRWFIYWMQSMPGRDNGLKLRGKNLTNWWIYVGDYDYAIRNSTGVVES
jgi:hypothetical protein